MMGGKVSYLLLCSQQTHKCFRKWKFINASSAWKKCLGENWWLRHCYFSSRTTCSPEIPSAQRALCAGWVGCAAVTLRWQYRQRLLLFPAWLWTLPCVGTSGFSVCFLYLWMTSKWRQRQQGDRSSSLLLPAVQLRYERSTSHQSCYWLAMLFIFKIIWIIFWVYIKFPFPFPYQYFATSNVCFAFRLKCLWM